MPEKRKHKIDFIFSVLDKAGVRKVDFARLTKISRVTLHRWEQGGNVTDYLRLNLAYTYALYLNRAVTSHLLPFTGVLKKQERTEALKKIISSLSTK